MKICISFLTSRIFHGFNSYGQIIMEMVKIQGKLKRGPAGGKIT
jgi:hypothetical protein